MDLCVWILADGGWWGCEDEDEDEAVVGWLVRPGPVKGDRAATKDGAASMETDRHGHRAEGDRRKMDKTGMGMGMAKGGRWRGRGRGRWGTMGDGRWG